MSANKTAKIGRPPIDIDWEQFDKLLALNPSEREVADFYNCSVQTVANKIRAAHDMTFCEYRDKKAVHTKLNIRRWQLEAAKKGNIAMLIWLGKVMLGQTERSIVETVPSPVDLAPKAKLTFEQFCIEVGYHKPFDKQCEMMKFGILSEGVRLILGSRGYGKTEYVVILGIAYQIYLRPLEYRVLIITKSTERNAAILKEISTACQKVGVVFAIDNSRSLRVDGLLGKDHSVSAATINSVTLRGRHPDLVVFDDPVTPDDTSDATRAKVKKVYDETIKLTKNVLLIGQPVHKFDLYQTLRNRVKKLEVPHGSIPELDADLDAQRIAGVDEQSIQASYHLRIMPDGSVLFEKIRYVDKFHRGEPTVAFIDPSFEGGDYTAMTVLRGYLGGVQIYGKAWKMDWSNCIEDIEKVCRDFKVQRLCFETNSLGEQPVVLLRGAIKIKGLGIVGRKSVGNKHARIKAAATFANLIHLAKDSDQQYIDQIIKYEFGAKNDDAPDSLASLLEWIGLSRGAAVPKA